MKSFLLIGLGRFGRHIAIQLNAQGHQIMAVDSNEDRVNDVLDIVTNAQIGDSTNAEFLKALGVRNFDVCIVAISGDFQSSLETTLYYRVVVIRAPLQGLCYTVRDAVDWFQPPTTRWFQKGSNHSPLQFC